MSRPSAAATKLTGTLKAVRQGPLNFLVPENVTRVELVPGAAPIARQWARETFRSLRYGNRGVDIRMAPAPSKAALAADRASAGEQDAEAAVGKVFITVSNDRSIVTVPLRPFAVCFAASPASPSRLSKKEKEKLWASWTGSVKGSLKEADGARTFD